MIATTVIDATTLFADATAPLRSLLTVIAAAGDQGVDVFDPRWPRGLREDVFKAGLVMRRGCQWDTLTPAGLDLLAALQGGGAA